DAYPSARTHIRWAEEARRVHLDQHRLGAERRVAPDSGDAIVVMVVHPHHEHLAAVDPEGRLTPRFLFVSLGNGEANLSNSAQRIAPCHHAVLATLGRVTVCHGNSTSAP